jgi:hypothetical protein
MFNHLAKFDPRTVLFKLSTIFLEEQEGTTQKRRSIYKVLIFNVLIFV